MKLLERLMQNYPDCSRRTLQNWIKWGRIAVDDSIITKATLEVTPDQNISINKKKKSVANIPILYEDRYLIIINKPAGLLSVPAENNQLNALSLLQEHYSLYAVHRIDQETSGTLLFARGKLSEKKFDQMFEEHTLTHISHRAEKQSEATRERFAQRSGEKCRLEREYLAIVEGNIPQDFGVWESYLREKENYDMEATSSDKGKHAVTHFKVMRRSKKFSYLHLRLKTGRKHQIRIHCRDAGYPIVGDRRYGSLIKNRLCLHAYRISFVHPFTGKAISITAPFPFKKFGSFDNYIAV